VERKSDYVELHARSAFSFLEGTSLPEDLVDRAGELDMPAIALLDRDCLSGAVRFHKQAQKRGLRALIGAEVTAPEGFRYPLLAETRAGYRNLCRLITRSRLEGVLPVAEHAEGLICLTGGSEGPLAHALGQGFDAAVDRVRQLAALFGSRNVYVEIQRHYHRDEEARNDAAREIAARLRLPLLATNGVCHATAAERELMDALTCVRHKTTLQRAGRLLARNAERHLKPATEMQGLFSDAPEAFANACELAARIGFTLTDLGYRFPRYPVPPGETMNSFLRQRTEEGARRRYRPYHDKARRQVERELALIEKLDLAGYFLIVWDIVEFCRREGILAQGRGSAANSAVCYSLGITAVDPVGMDLLFERFLSEERGEWPDIDIDLPSGEERERVIQYVYQRYGSRGAAMTANVITYCGRSAVRDIGKVLGFDPETLRRLSHLTGRGGWERDPANKSYLSPEEQFRQAGLDRGDPLIGKFFALILAVQDLPRHLGQHSGGMVICEGELDSIVPLQPAAMPGRVIVQWDKEDCADMGIVKVDLLGLGMMAVIRDSLDLIRKHYGEEVDLAHLPQDDPAVYQALQQADTIGMFQVESRAQMSCLPRMKPEKFYDLVVQVAIIRPGPIAGKMLHPYLRRRQGLEEPVALHPLLDPVLERTLGVPLFQEQLLRMAMIVAGFSGGEAEELRRALGFKRSQKRMAEVEVKLRSGMERNGITGPVQDAIVQSIGSFALYGFPESHAASFALLSYASAYLKCHYLAAFTAALLNNQPMGFYSPLTIVKDAQRHGLRFLPVDAAHSDWLCAITADGAVRLGFNYVKGFRQQTAEALIAERARRPFRGIDDLKRRVPQISKAELNALAELGALNTLSGRNLHRRDALWMAELALRPAGPLLDEAATPPETASPLAPMNSFERLRADFQNSGLTIGPHPMRFCRDELDRKGIVPASRLKDLPDGRVVRVAGGVICRQQPSTAKGFVFLSLEDETGIANIILSPAVFTRLRPIVVQEPYLMVHGILQNQGGVVAVKAGRVEPFQVRGPTIASHDFH
jgi:error-prone DNA polymerase